MSSIGAIPKEIVTHILKNIPPKGACKFALVSKVWNAAWKSLTPEEGPWRLYEPKVLFPEATHLDIGVWKRRVPEAVLKKLTFEKEHCPRFDKETYIGLQGLEVEGKTGDDRFTVLRLPAGLDLPMLINEIAKDTIQGPETPIIHIHSEFQKLNSGDKIKKDQTVVILNGVLKGSLDLLLEIKQELACQSGCEALKVASLFVLRHKEASPANFFTHCSNRFEPFLTAVGFIPEGLIMDLDCTRGVGALRNLEDIGDK